MLVNIKDFLANKKYQNFFIIILVVILLTFLFQTFRKAYRDIGYDLTVYLMASNALFNNNNPYLINPSCPYIYPLFLAFIFYPFKILPYSISIILWYVINILSLYYSVKIIVEISNKNIKIKWQNNLIIPLIIIFILLITPIQSNLLCGQINIVVLLFCILFYKYMYSDDFLSSIYLSIAISIKLFPIIFFVFLIFNKKYKILLLSIIFTVLLCLLPMIIIGNKIFDYYITYFNYYLLANIKNQPSCNFGSQTGHIFFTVSGFLTYFFPQTKPNVEIKVFSIVLTLLPIIYLDFISNFNKKYFNTYIFCLYLLASLMINPISEKHHLSAFIPAVCIIILKVVFDNTNTKKINILLIVLFFIFLFSAKINKYSPMYFFSILTLYLNLYLITFREVKKIRNL